MRFWVESPNLEIWRTGIGGGQFTTHLPPPPLPSFPYTDSPLRKNKKKSLIFLPDPLFFINVCVFERKGPRGNRIQSPLHQSVREASKTKFNFRFKCFVKDEAKKKN